MNNYRSFTIVSIKTTTGKINYTEGRFISSTPSGAARKMFTQAYRYKKGQVKSMKITLRETTQNSNKKEYTYRITKKAEKTVVERDGEEITFNYTTKIKSL
jgi:hypothetical protein